jgi:hypothetical protein
MSSASNRELCSSMGLYTWVPASMREESSYAAAEGGGNESVSPLPIV